MPDEKEISNELKKRKEDTRVSKKGHIYKTAEYDLEPPIREKNPKGKKKSKKQP